MVDFYVIKAVVGCNEHGFAIKSCDVICLSRHGGDDHRFNCRNRTNHKKSLKPGLP